MRYQYLLILVALCSQITVCAAQVSKSNYPTGFYTGLEGGINSYNTQITFDGVDDPAGRSGAGYGAFLGYNYIANRSSVGAELLFNLVSDPNPYTFDPAVVGFAELELRRAASIGLDIRIGYVAHKNILLCGIIGYSANKQSVYIDGATLNQFAGAVTDKRFGTFQFGASTEIAIYRNLGLRFTFRAIAGHDLSAADFGTIPTNASLARFDVEPRLEQFFAGLAFRL